MQNRYKSGNAIAQYGIIIALISIVLIPGFYFIGSSINNYFSGFSSGLNPEPKSLSAISDNSTNTLYLNNLDPELKIEPGQLNGNNQTPVKVCKDGTCSIDFGDFVIEGIPEDFNEFVQTVGSPGASDYIASIFEQIANQLATDGFKNESIEVRKLAKLGHNLSSIEKQYESGINTCNYEKNCIMDFMNEEFEKPANYDVTYFDEPSKLPYNDMLKSMCIGCARTYKNDGDSYFTDAINKDWPAFHYVNQLDTVIEQTNISDNIKNVIKELSWDIGMVGEDFSYGTRLLYNNIKINDDNTYSYNDPLTGNKIKKKVPDNVVDNFANYNASSIVNFDSKLICASANPDEKCH